MKYIDAEKLKEILLPSYKEAKKESLSTTDAVKWEKVEYIFDFVFHLIDSLQQNETQVDKMLCSQVWWEEQGWIMIPPDATIEGIDSLLRQVRKKLQQEQPEVDLEKEIEKEWKECDPIDEGMGVESAYIHIEAFDIIAHRFFELGKKDMKKQMMKESVEANVIATKRDNKYQQLLITDWNGFNDLLNADKVRIIIVKEEENK